MTIEKKPYPCQCDCCREHSAKQIIFTTAFILACAFLALFITHRNVKPQVRAAAEARP